MTTNIATKASPNNPFIGKTLGGKYSIERLIGRGGMGLVHLAREHDGDREVVIKMLAPHFAEDGSAVARFEREGRRLAQLFHPNIVELFDLGWDEDQSYIVMEYIDGEPLRYHLGRKERLSAREFAPIAEQVLSAVAVAHEQKMMLRDIKPSNIMLCERDGKSSFVKMLDFGLAKLVDGDDVEVTKAHVIGTAGYLAPEQIKGEDTDVRVDVYALGILFFVMLTGKSPILGENDGAVLYNHVHGEPLRLEACLPEGHGVPDKLIALIHQCMEKSPVRRPDDAKAITKVLHECFSSDWFELPAATEETRAAIEAFKRSKIKTGKNLDDIEPSSSEWTRPHLRKLLSDGTIAEVRKPKKPPGAKPPRRLKKNTVMGLAPADSAPKPPPRRPPPAKTPASSRMERVTGERKTLSPLQNRGKVRRPMPRSLVRLEEAAIPEIDVEPDEPSAAETLHGIPSVEVDTTPRAPAPTMNVTPVIATPALADYVESITGSQPSIPVRTEIPITGPVIDVAPSLGQTEAALPVLPSAIVQTEPQHEPLVEISPDEVEEITEGEGSARTLPPQRARPPAASAAFGASVTEEARPVWVYLLSGVAGVLIVGMIGYLLMTATDVEAPSTTAQQTVPTKPAPQADAVPQDAAPEPTVPPADEVPAAAQSSDGEVQIDAPAEAVLFIDDREIGVGVFSGSLPAGSHRIRVEQPGYQPFELDVDVVAGDNPPVAVEMVAVVPPTEAPKRPAVPRAKPRPRLPKKTGPKSSGGATADPFPDPTPAPKAEPPPKAEPKPEPKPEPKSDDDMFIEKPKKKKGSGIFLPVGEK